MTQTEVDEMFGRLFPATAPVCPDWAGHRTLYAQREVTWTLSAEQKRADWAEGCGWCGGPLPAPDLAAALLLPDSLPEVAR